MSGERYILFRTYYYYCHFYYYYTLVLEHLHSVTAHDLLIFNQLNYFTKGYGSKNTTSSESTRNIYLCLQAKVSNQNLII
jgi:hypothetical protein